MALTKADIIESVHQQIGFPQKKSTEVVEQLIETIKSILASGEDVLVSGFGKFSVNEKKERRGQFEAVFCILTANGSLCATSNRH